MNVNRNGANAQRSETTVNETIDITRNEDKVREFPAEYINCQFTFCSINQEEVEKHAKKMSPPGSKVILKQCKNNSHFKFSTQLPPIYV